MQQDLLVFGSPGEGSALSIQPLLRRCPDLDSNPIAWVRLKPGNTKRKEGRSEDQRPAICNHRSICTQSSFGMRTDLSLWASLILAQ